MPNVAYQLTLTSEQANSGPYYIVTYTTGSTFVPVLAGSPAFLPNVGSTAIVQIPSAASSASYLAFKLNNEGDQGPCAYCDNDVILVITGSTPTASICCTGSLLAVNQCLRYTIENFAAPTRFFNYTDCNRQSQTLTLTGFTSASICLFDYEFNSEVNIIPAGTCTESGSLSVLYNSSTASSTCLSCSFVTVQTSSNGINWGGNKTGSCGTSQSISLDLPSNISGSGSLYYFRIFQTCSGSVTSSFFNTGSLFVSASLPTSSCCEPTITSTTLSGSFVSLAFTLPASASCQSCSAITVETSVNNITWTGSNTAGCTSPFLYSTASLATASFHYFRMYQNCVGGATSSYSNTGSLYISGSATGSGCTGTTVFTIRNASCGGGTVNDIGLNGVFFGSLSGPSTFPLTSTLYGTKTNPSGLICSGSNTIQANVTTNIAGVGNCGAMFIYINGSPGPNYTYFFGGDPYPQITGVNINAGDTVEVMISCFSGSCPP